MDAPIVQMFHTLGEMKNRVARTEAEREGSYRLDGERGYYCSERIGLLPPLLQNKLNLNGYIRLMRKKIIVIPPGVDTSHFYPIPADEARQFIGLASGCAYDLVRWTHRTT